MQSSDRGQTFSANKKIADATCQCCRLAVQNDQNERVSVLWRHIFGKNTRDHALVNIEKGELQGNLNRLSEDNWQIDGCPHHGPSLDIDDQGRYHAVWFTAGDNRKGLFYSSSTNQGQSFTTPMGLGDPYQSSHPYVLTSDNNVFVVWKEFNGEATEIKYMESPDRGDNWSTPMSISASTSESGHPLLLKDEKWIYLSWRTGLEGYRLFKISGIPERATHENVL